MYTKKETEYQNHPVIVNVIEDYTGGGTLARADVVTADELKPGVIVGKDANGLFHVVKTAEVHADSATSTVQIKKGSEVKVGDVLVDAALALKAYDITAIDTANADYDELTLDTALGALTEGDVLVQATAVAAVAGTGTVKYAPLGITMSSVDVSVANQQVGILVRGTVKEALLPYAIDANIKGLLSLIRFV